MSHHGLLIVDKPAGWTSHDVVAKARRVCGTRRVGHAGTLDAMATGVLVLGVGKATKMLTFLVGLDKGYAGTIRLGQSTVTDDAEGEITDERDAGAISDGEITAAVATLTGAIEQVPSAVSAIKVNGVRSYARVRAGEEVALVARPVTVRRFEIERVERSPDAPATVVDLDITVEVTSGTYVRALARDLGAALGVGGHLTALRRTHVGRYDLSLAHTLEQAEALPERGIVDMATAAQAAFVVRRLSDDQEQALRHGQRIDVDATRHDDPVAAIGTNGELVAIMDESGEMARSRVVFPAG